MKARKAKSPHLSGFSRIIEINKRSVRGFSMAKIVSVANQKGGVGKTTTALNLAAAIAEKGSRVLIVDVDPQGNATSGCGINKKGISASSYDVLLGLVPAGEAILKTEVRRLHILPSSINLAGAELELVEMEKRDARLRIGLYPVLAEYDYIFIDCPPSLGLLTLNALSASDSVLVPIQCEFFALEGLSQLTNTLRQVKKLYNPRLDIEGVLLTMYDARLNLTLQVVREVKQHFGDKVFKSVIPRNVRLSEAPSFGQSIFQYDRSSKGACAYMDLAEEFLSRSAAVR